MNEETPNQRLERLLKKNNGVVTPKDDDYQVEHGIGRAHEAEKARRARDAVQQVVEELKKAIGGGNTSSVEVHEMKIGADGEVTVDGKSMDDHAKEVAKEIGDALRAQAMNDKNLSHDEMDKGGIISMQLDLSPIHEIIQDSKVANHGEQIMRLHDLVVKQLNDMDGDNPLTQFVGAMGTIVTRAGMSGAMILAGKRGRGMLGPEDFHQAMVGSVGGIILTALRYGQQNPDALTLADGVDDSQISSAIDNFLAGFGGGDASEEGND